MTVDLDRLEALAREATPGPWLTGDVWDLDETGIIGPADTAYIAAVDPSTILALIARLRTAEAAVEAWSR